MITIEQMREQYSLVADILELIEHARPEEMETLGEMAFQWRDCGGERNAGNFFATIAKQVLDSETGSNDPDGEPNSPAPASSLREQHIEERADKPIVPGWVKLSDKELLELAGQREPFRALHIFGWWFDPEEHRSKPEVVGLMPEMDVDLDFLVASQDVIALQETAAHVTVVVRRDCISADAARLLRKVADAIQTKGLDNLDGSLTESPALKRWRGSHTAQLDGAA